MSGTVTSPPHRPSASGGRTAGARLRLRPSVRVWVWIWVWIWRTVVRGAVGLPLAVAAVPMALVGAGGAAARAQQGMIQRFGTGPGPVEEQDWRPGAGRVVAHSFVVVLPALLSFVGVALCVFVCYSGHLYFLRPDASFALGHPFTPDDRFNTSWGGPTLVGAWFIHACVALAHQILALPLIRGLTALQDRASRRLLAS
ncbi:hypothetical protein ABZW18_07505 [Streptomyces sp. NPDC004647]|uniref:hypothetical protein n=1 Tax=Streptomyces sp. NPDC004647 TaxID=3154671 RepID=UPI0033B42F34